ncbi:purine-nucleoside phosphorylase [Marinitoga litoralis]|nr:purine-nucleoside phosphorylase [Marinitoga litoralis]MBM7559332.1 purine-nucleoside phosphorylase [Marinitoga litoralis]
MIPTPHIEVDKKGIIAETVIMPGDPLRAKFIAENFLENPILFNKVRNMFGYTGTYKGKKISVMGSGMGMPSIGIYSYELFKFYDVQNIIRVGSCGAYSEDIDLYDVILVEDAYSESTYAKVMAGIEDNILKPSEDLNKRLEDAAKKLSIPIHKGRIHSSDVFYRQNFEDYKKIRDNYGCIAVEMESFALFANAKVTGKNAACLLTVSDSLVTMKATTSEERMKSFTNMMKIALEMA